MRALLPYVVLFPLLPQLSAQQRTLVVDRVQGPYFEIYAALLAGQPGDRIEVHAGAMPYAPITVTYGVEIIADSGTRVGGITISNISSMHAVRIDGLQVDATTIGPPNPVVLQQCQGIVHLHQVNALDGIVANNVATLAISNSTVVGAAEYTTLPNIPIVYPGLSLTSSRVVVSNCSITGGNGGSLWSNLSRVTGGAGILVATSEVVLSDCTVLGGQGSSIFYNLGCTLVSPGNGGNGIDGVGFNNPVTAVGTGSISGGAGGCCSCPVSPGSGLVNINGARIGPGVTVSYSTVPVNAIAEPPHLSMPLILQQGGVTIVQVAGTSARSVLLGIDIWNGYTGVTGVVLPFVLTPAATLYAFAPPGPGASVQFALAIPAVPWLLQQFVHVQAVTVAASGMLEFSNGGFGRIR